MIDRKIFFDRVRRAPFGGSLTPNQVDGMNVVLDVWEQNFVERTPLTQFSICLATQYHETGGRMQPIKELGGPEYLRLNYDVTGRNPDRAKRMGNLRPGDGIKYCGRGDVQLTWYVNYLKATNRLRALGLIGPEIDFIKDPDRVMEPRIAALIMLIGMEEGWFTGKKLDDLVDPNIDGNEHAEAVRSRAIINGTDRAEKIAGYADDFLAALVAANKGAGAKLPPIAAPKPPAPPDIPALPTPPKPIDAPAPPPAPEPGFWTKFGNLFKPQG